MLAGSGAETDMRIGRTGLVMLRTDASAAIFRWFPSVPQALLQTILDHRFHLGSALAGTGGGADSTGEPFDERAGRFELGLDPLIAAARMQPGVERMAVVDRE